MFSSKIILSWTFSAIRFTYTKKFYGKLNQMKLLKYIKILEKKITNSTNILSEEDDIWKGIFNVKGKEWQKLFSNQVDLWQSKLLLKNYNKRRFVSCIRLFGNNSNLVNNYVESRSKFGKKNKKYLLTESILLANGNIFIYITNLSCNNTIIKWISEFIYIGDKILSFQYNHKHISMYVAILLEFFRIFPRTLRVLLYVLIK